MSSDTIDVVGTGPAGAAPIAYEAVGTDVCHNCEERIDGEPVYFDGEAYCCTGCLNGGPCVCTYTPRAPEATSSAPPSGAPDPLAPETGANAPGKGTDAAPCRAPATAAVDGEPTIVLRVGRFADQPELLRFARDLENDPRVHEVSLIRGGDLADVWLSVHTTGAAELTLALHALTRFEVLSSNVLAGGMEARVSALPAAGGEASAQLLPPRPRPRIAWTRPASNTPAQPADDAIPSSPATPPAPARVPPPMRTAASLPAASDGREPAAPIPVPDASLVREVPAETHADDAAHEAIGTPDRPVTQPTPIAQPAPIVERVAPAAWQPAAPADAAVEAPTPLPAATAPPAAEPARHVDDDRMVGVDERPGGAVALTEHVTLVVYPFRSFGALNEFQSAVQGLRGVKGVRVRRFYKGTLHLAVEYEDLIPLAQRLNDLHAFPWTLVSESRSELELRLDAGHAFAAGEGAG